MVKSFKPMQGLPAVRSNGRGMQPAAPQLIYWPYTAPEDLPDTHGSGHIHCTVVGFRDVTPEGNLTDAINIEVECNLADINDECTSIEELAIARANKLLQRQNYRLVSVRESCSLDDAVKKKE